MNPVNVPAKFELRIALPDFGWGLQTPNLGELEENVRSRGWYDWWVPPYSIGLVTIGVVVEHRHAACQQNMTAINFLQFCNTFIIHEVERTRKNVIAIHVVSSRKVIGGGYMPGFHHSVAVSPFRCVVVTFRCRPTRAAVGMGIPMGIPMGVGMGWVWGLWWIPMGLWGFCGDFWLVGD